MDTPPDSPSLLIFRIPEGNAPGLETKLAALARKAGRLGLTPPTLLYGGHEDEPVLKDVLNSDEVVGYKRYLHVLLTGEAPAVPGWALVAVIEHTSDSEVGNVVRGVPGREVPASYRQAGPLCQHCNTTRRRQESFVLVDPSGVYKQVGRNCLADFLREPDAAARLCGTFEWWERAASLCEGEEYEPGGGGGGVHRVDTLGAVALTARLIRHCGWLSRSLARKREEEGGRVGTPTANLVESVLFYPQHFFRASRHDTDADRALRAAARSVEDCDVETAAAALSWIREMRPQAESLDDYLYNLLVVASGESVRREHLGLLCSAVSAHERSLRREEARKEAASRPPSRHIGSVGDKGRWVGSLAGHSAFESEWGAKYLYRFNIDGNDAVWWSTVAYGPEGLARGAPVALVGRVKSHGEYKGRAQTEFTRCSLYFEAEGHFGKCPNCGGMVLPCDLKKNCPHCRKRGLKVAAAWFPEAFSCQSTPT